MTPTWAQICARRLRRHGLIKPVAAARFVEQVGLLCGAHAQVMAAAELSIGLRVEGITQATVRAALWEERSLVKTHGPRGTVHLFPVADLALWTGALSAAPRAATAPPNLRLTPEQTDEIVAAITAALAKDDLTIDELGETVVRQVGAWAGDLVWPAFTGMWPLWRQTISTAANRGALCFGPNRGRNVTYSSPGRWVAGFKPMAGPTALAELVKRFLFAYGPATPQQFAQWLGAPRPWAVALFKSLGDELDPVAMEDAQAWVVAGDTEWPDEPPNGVRLLPYFDVYGIGCHPRERVFPGHAAERALAGGQAGPIPLLLVDGVAGGVWSQRRRGRKLAITVESFHDLTPMQRRELGEQVERVGQIQAAPVELTIGEVTAGRHL